MRMRIPRVCAAARTRLTFARCLIDYRSTRTVGQYVTPDAVRSHLESSPGPIPLAAQPRSPPDLCAAVGPLEEDGNIRMALPLAVMIPSPIPPSATPGERRVYDALSALPETLTVWYRRLFPGRRHVDEPDFVVIGADIGLIVLEVKDWKRGRSPEGLRKENPLAQAKRYVHGLQDLVRKRGFPVLVEAEGPHQKDLVFPCVPAVVFPHLTRESWEEEGAAAVDARHVLFREDLAQPHPPTCLSKHVRDRNLCRRLDAKDWGRGGSGAVW